MPALPAGVTYTTFACGDLHSLALRSDGQAVAWGWNCRGQCNVPILAPGLRWVAFAGGYMHSMALLSDGSLLGWGDNSSGQCNVPPLPAGLSYVEIAGGAEDRTTARRSDGSIVTFGGGLQAEVPVPPAGLVYVGLGGGQASTCARLGPTSTYTTFGRDAVVASPTRLVPSTPRASAQPCRRGCSICRRIWRSL